MAKRAGAVGAKTESESQKKLLADLNERYFAALEKLKAEFKGGKAIEEHFEGVYKETTFLRSTFFNERFKEPNMKTGITEKFAVVAAAGLIDNVPRHVLRIVSKKPDLPLDKQHDGFYRYWRNINEEPTEFVRWGLIELKTVTDEGTKFRHWSYDHLHKIKIRYGEKFDGYQKLKEIDSDSKLKPLQWEDEGYAFYTSQKFFFIGFRLGNIRLSVSTPIIENDDRSKVILNGIALTTSRSNASTFASGFVMVHESNPQFHESMTHEMFKNEVAKEVETDKFLIHDR
jgi:hypothetical protein